MVYLTWSAPQVNDEARAKRAYHVLAPRLQGQQQAVQE